MHFHVLFDFKAGLDFTLRLSKYQNISPQSYERGQYSETEPARTLVSL